MGSSSRESAPTQAVLVPRFLPQLHTSQQDPSKSSTDIQVEEMNEYAVVGVAAESAGVSKFGGESL